MSPTVRVQLSLLMFLQYFVWGSWYGTMGPYLPKTAGSPDPRKGLAYGTPEVFAGYARPGRELGFRHVAAGPFVRSSYHAEATFTAAEQVEEYF